MKEQLCKVILPSVTYGIAIWGNRNNLCRAGRLIFNLPRDTPSVQVMELTQRDSIYDVYKRSLFKLIYNIPSDYMPAIISDLVVRQILFVTEELYCGNVF